MCLRKYLPGAFFAIHHNGRGCDTKTGADLRLGIVPDLLSKSSLIELRNIKPARKCGMGGVCGFLGLGRGPAGIVIVINQISRRRPPLRRPPRSLRALMPSANVDAVLAGATAKGLLTRIGVRGGARYVLSEEVVLRVGATGVQARSRQQQMLLDEMDRQGSISTLEGSELLKEPMTVVRDLLNNLVLAGAVSAEGRTRARRYYPND